MPWRLKYPEASAKRSHYQALVSSLTANRNTVASNVNSSRTVPTASLSPADADGAYFDQYITRRDNWIDIHTQTIRTFDTFLADLDNCITRASSLELMWAGRIGIREWYE